MPSQGVPERLAASVADQTLAVRLDPVNAAGASSNAIKDS
ncbi:Uncharacterised protein [Mycobacterium xenopi]|uniref:Uncharacterized protein n=2 Tax=Mycobacterium xenopi TaxID=1789 RepID=A0AAD1H1M2_MYCXE|nr:hypothetical protein MYXE_28780 [Mycobacterium xenopi]SPX88740.1 Uncharacterised protein [Mycobacterium xenopi]